MWDSTILGLYRFVCGSFRILWCFWPASLHLLCWENWLSQSRMTMLKKPTNRQPIPIQYQPKQSHIQLSIMFYSSESVISRDHQANHYNTLSLLCHPWMVINFLFIPRFSDILCNANVTVRCNVTAIRAKCYLFHRLSVNGHRLVNIPRYR